MLSAQLMPELRSRRTQKHGAFQISPASHFEQSSTYQPPEDTYHSASDCDSGAPCHSCH